ncbi:hypothetical protein AGR7A_Lc10245 [Agrobacterium deltaense NCPPB 1641]|uniref:Uncharacterized protein n=1 Tax=Agrobacterium deltaense NCPPB 1641 TaxID=1183425 RepID=A0A1S7TT93_9HYPH|nr:hypothetical protein AGR7A_Lc10245 [Agrobacterium deltaense NCPPB 1641]
MGMRPSAGAFLRWPGAFRMHCSRLSKLEINDFSYSPHRAAREKAYGLPRAARSFLYVAGQIVPFINSCIRDL